MNQERSILIVSHTFPPAGGIGGRRWAKFAKYLRKAGVQVEVLMANRPIGDSSWSEDVAGIRRTTYPHRFPRILQRTPKGLIEKLRYRFALTGNRMHSEGSPYDRALFDEEAFVNALQQLLSRDKIDTVIITAAPFRLPWYALQLRRDFPEVAFIVDFRDPWTSGTTFGYQSISKRRKAFEAAAEAAVVEGFELVTTPWPGLVEELRTRYPQKAESIVWLPHCYDADEVVRRAEAPKRKVPKILYGGNLYDGLDEVYRTLSDMAREGKVEVDLWPSSYRASLQGWVHDNFRVHKSVKSRVFFKEAARADALLFPIPKTLRNGYPTKLLEFAATGAPLLAVGYRGTLSDTVEERGLGTFTDLETDMEHWPQMASTMPQTATDLQWLVSHEAATITSRLLEWIEKIAYAH